MAEHLANRAHVIVVHAGRAKQSTLAALRMQRHGLCEAKVYSGLARSQALMRCCVHACCDFTMLAETDSVCATDVLTVPVLTASALTHLRAARSTRREHEGHT
jgi:hypothetical protein